MKSRVFEYLRCGKEISNFSKLSIFCYSLYLKLFRKIFGMNPNVYISSFEHVHIGKNVEIASGVSIVANNHDVYDVTKSSDFEDIYIGDNSWIGANAVILPGVKLGKNTIVGAGAIVTKSFPEGYCILTGNPAKILKTLDKKLCRK